MTPELLIPLVAGHLIGDFVLQTDGMVRDKHKLPVMTLHSGIVALVSWGLTGYLLAWWWVAPLIFASHFVIDLTKVRAAAWLAARKPREAPGFLDQNGLVTLFALDQVAHFAVIALLAERAGVIPELRATVMGEGAWIEVFGGGYLDALVLASGWILVAMACGHFLGLLLQRFEAELLEEQKDGLSNGGYWIGITERSLIYLFILVGEPTGIGFLAAAKSVFRIGEIKEAKDRKLAEYILIGTLMSFALAMVLGLLVREALSGLP